MSRGSDNSENGTINSSISFGELQLYHAERDQTLLLKCLCKFFGGKTIFHDFLGTKIVTFAICMGEHIHIEEPLFMKALQFLQVWS